jgi:hypothetical protein
MNALPLAAFDKVSISDFDPEAHPMRDMDSRVLYEEEEEEDEEEDDEDDVVTTSLVKVGDSCMADPCVEGEFEYGKITRICNKTGMAYSNLKCGQKEFCGSIPTEKEDGSWKFTDF